MRDKWQVVLSGAGGQGLILAGTLLGEAAVLIEGKNAVQTQSYGVESRGGFSKSEVVISSQEIAYPKVIEPDIVLALTQEAYNRYHSKITAGCFFVCDNSQIADVDGTAAGVHAFPFTEMAREAGNPGMANMVALGAIVALTGVVGVAAVEKVMAERFAKRPLNIEAFKMGCNLLK
ncbi:MAG: 2-oxoacid:acceptor oxidoreductase family protein [bacterium]|jgi:2-oxoglutarate ferredoxin oxidoreductase subunit gamma